MLGRYIDNFDYSSRFRILKGGKISLVVSAFLASATLSFAAPVGEQVVSGNVAIDRATPNVTNINQSTNKSIINWQNFNVAGNETVNFNMPSSSSSSLNRVIGNEASAIYGKINSNGQVFLVNQNGIYFSKDSQVNTAGFTASTRNISDENFLNGNYIFEGTSDASIINLGTITTDNAYTALLAKKVENEGVIKAHLGQVQLASGERFTLDINGNSLVKLTIDKGTLDGLVANKGAIIADGGEIYLTTSALDTVLSGLVNNTGLIQANEVEEKDGKIILFAHGGTGEFGGNIEAVGGFVETSGENLRVADSTMVKAKTWLLDPTDITITNGGADGIGGSSIDADTITAQLNIGTSVILQADNDITINEDITTAPSADTSLTFKAGRNITLNNSITASSNKLNIQFWADSDNSGDGINIIKGSNITTNGGSLTFGNGSATTINGVSTLVGGDVYFNGLSAQTLSTGGGAVNIQGAAMIANSNGLDINTAGGNVTFSGLLDAGNSYAGINSVNMTWTNAKTAAKGATEGERATGDTYLATITSRLENAISGQSVNYQEAWLGGERVTGIETDGYWRWVTGPEGLQDSGRGLVFFQQTGPGTGTSVGYSNWNPLWGGEPNNNADGLGPYPMSNPSETALQFTGTAGQWNDLSSSNTGVSWYVKETNLAASPLTINAGSGSVILGGAVGSNKALASLNITAGTTAINGGGVTTEGLQTYTSNVALGSSNTTLTQTSANTNFTLQNAKSITNATSADATLSIKTTGDIVLNDNSSISSSLGKLNTVLWSDSDANSDGMIYLKNGSSITTNGGDITFSGGSDITTGYATGNAQNSNGVTLDNVDLLSGSGNILIRGKSGTAVTSVAYSVGTFSNLDGVRLHGGNTLDSGNGTITIVGESVGTTATANNGIELSHSISDLITSSNTGANAIVLNGTSGSSASSNAFGIYTWLATIQATNGGGIYLKGNGQKDDGVTIASGSSVLANSGKITIEGTGYGASGKAVNIVGTLGQKSGSSVTSSSSDIEIIGNTFGTSGTLQSSGNLIIKPYTASTTIGIGGATGTLALASSYFSTNFLDGFSGITVGSSDQTGAIAIDATAISDELTLYTQGSVTQSGAITGNQNLNLLGTNGIYTLDNTANNINTLTANTGSVTYVDSDALTLGAITATGAVNVATQTGNMTLDGNIATTDTTSSPITLNAGKNTDTGTSTGGNIIHTSGTITTGTDGRATIYSGSIAGSTGLTTLLGSGSGHFRYNSDETSTGYTTALGSGIYAIYREQPTILIAPDAKTITYGDSDPTFTYTSSGFVNGDTNAILSGTASFSIAGTTSAAGKYTAGAHNINYTSGLANGLGYALSDKTSVTDELTVNQKDLAVSGLTASNKVYDGTTVATLGGTAAITALGSDVVTLGGTAVGAFATKDAGTAKAITVTGKTITGADAGNYNLIQQTGLTADITPVPTPAPSGPTAAELAAEAARLAAIAAEQEAARLAEIKANETTAKVIDNIIPTIPTPPPPAPTKTAAADGKGKTTITTTVTTAKVGSVAAPTQQATMTEVVKAIVPELSGSTASFTVVSESTGSVSKVTMEQLQAQTPSGTTSEIRVALAPDSYVALVNGGVSLPAGVSQEFYVVEDKE